MKKLLLFLSIPVMAAFGQTETDSIKTQELNEIIVNGEKPQIQSNDGILIVDLPAIVKNKPVTNILEALGYLPGVVNNNGTIALNGTMGVTIILNGELTNMPVQNLYQLLYSIPVDRLKNVEIMYAAPAKYHISGAVINIVLKTPRAIDGLTGQVQSNYNQAHYASYGSGLAATYALNDWSFDMNWTITRNRTWNRQETSSNHLIGTQHTIIDDDMRQLGRNISNSIYASATYKTLKLTYNGQINTNSANTSLSDGTLGEYTNNYSFLSPIGYHNIALRYKSSFGLTVGGDFTAYSEKGEQTLSKKGSGLLVNAVKNQRISKYHAYADKEHQFGKWQLNYGIEYQHSDDHSRQNYIMPPTDGFDDILKEDVADAYIGVQTSLDCGLSFNASTKMEYYHNSYKKNWNFVPQLGATYYKTPKSIFQLNLTTQRIYPQYWELHGGTSYINDYSIIKGNPALQPYLNYSGQVSYILNQKYAATLYVLYADKYAVQLPYQLPDELKLLFQTVNLDYSRTVGIQFHAPFKIREILNSTVVINISHKREKSSHFHDISFDNEQWGVYGCLNNTIRFTESCPISLSVDVAYISGQIQGAGRFNSLWKVDAGAKWQFGKKRCCEFDLKCNDIFNTWNPKLTIRDKGQDYIMKIHHMTQSLNLSFIWRFNGFKPKDTSVDTSRFGTGN